jgi:hypothetical protein
MPASIVDMFGGQLSSIQQAFNFFQDSKMNKEKDPKPYIGEDGILYIPLFGKHTIECLNALLIAGMEKPKSRKHRSKLKGKLHE